MHPKPICGFCSHSHFDRATVRSCVFNENSLNVLKWRDSLALLHFVGFWNSSLGIIQDIISLREILQFVFKMAKTKCKLCSSTLPSGDIHSYCLMCRNSKKGDDPCVKDRTCKFYEVVAKATQKKVNDGGAVDDSILDDPDPPSAVAKVATSAESTSSTSAR